MANIGTDWVMGASKNTAQMTAQLAVAAPMFRPQFVPRAASVRTPATENKPPNIQAEVFKISRS